MPAVAAVVQVVVSSAIAESVTAAVSTIVGNAVIASAVSGAITGAVSAAAAAAVTGGDVKRAARSGARFGGVSGGAQKAVDPTVGRMISDPRTRAAVTSAIGQTAGGIAEGLKPREALLSGAIGGVTQYAIPEKAGAKGVGRLLTGAERQLLGSELGRLVSPSEKRYTPSAPVTGGYATPQAQPSTTALSQALRTGEPGGPVFGGTGDEKGRRGKWNVESLRYMGGSEG